MRRAGVWRGALMLGNVKIVDVRQEVDAVICRVETPRRQGPRCGRCGRVCPWYDPPAVGDHGELSMSGAGGLGWKRSWAG